MARSHEVITAAELKAMGGLSALMSGATKPDRWANAKAKPETVDGVRFRSATEARVYRRMKRELWPEEKLLVHVRLPLWALAPRFGKLKRHCYYEADFVILDAATLRRIIDAKPKNFDRDGTGWRRTRAAVEASYGIRVEVVSE